MGWWVGSLIGQKGLCGFLLSFFVFFSLLHPAPRSLLLITDGPPLTMPCMHADARATEGVRGVWGGMCGGCGGRVGYVPFLDHTTPSQAFGAPLRKEPLTTTATLRAKGVGLGGRKKVTVRATPCARPGAASGMVIFGVRVWVGAWVCTVLWYLCAPVFPCVGVGPWAAQELLVQLCGVACRAGQGGQAGILSCPRRCAALGAVPPRGRDPGPPLAWCGVADGGGGGDLLFWHGCVWRDGGGGLND